MSLKQLQAKRSEQGFTIVELLIVIVIIGILAAIVIVAYTGITQRAKASSAQSNAKSILDLAEVINADNGSYPANKAALDTGSTTSKTPSGVTVIDGTAAGITDSTNENTIWYKANATSGACIAYTDPSKAAGSRITYLYAGDGKTGNVTAGTCG